MGVDRKTGGAPAHQVKCQGSGDCWIATRIAADIEQLGLGGSRVVLKANQGVAIAGGQRQVVAAKSGETVPMNVGESQSNGQSRQRSSESAGSDQNAEGHRNQVKGPDVPVDGRVVCRIDHKQCESQTGRIA